MTPEREAEIRASVALTGYDRREPGDSPGEQIRDTLAALDAERERAARLERERDELRGKLVALREELDGPVVFACDEEILAASKRRAALLASTAPAVEEYTRRAQVEALESAANDYAAIFGNGDVPKMLRNRAAKIRGGR